MLISTYIMQVLTGLAATGALVLLMLSARRKRYDLVAINAIIIAVNAGLFGFQIFLRNMM